jgi:DNA modification methylase
MLPRCREIKRDADMHGSHQSVSPGIDSEEKFHHPTQKPVELMRRPILNHTQTGELVYDQFLGSGTTLAAAEVTGGVCCVLANG